MKTFYLTRKALSKGILTIKSKNYHIGEKWLIIYHQELANVPIRWIKKPDWHLTKKEALLRAMEMQKNEIKKAYTKINRLTNLKFK